MIKWINKLLIKIQLKLSARIVDNDKIIKKLKEDKMDERLKRLKEALKVQCNDGNWNYDAYMHGYANGLILAYSIMNNTDAKFLEAPKKWLSKTKKK